MTPTANKWLEQARYDLETAPAMLASERCLYVLFCCRQAVEKALKALIVERSREFPHASIACRGRCRSVSRSQ